MTTDTKKIAARISAGESVKSVAAELGVTPVAIYRRLERSGQSVQSLRAEPASPSGVSYRKIPGYPGYRAGDDGAIQSCLASAAGQTNWRSLRQSAARGPLEVAIGGGKRRSVRGLLVAAWGERRGGEIFDGIGNS